MTLELQAPLTLPEELPIFYCWQDHLDKRLHRFLIRDALHAAISRVQDEMPSHAKCVLRLDSDTANRSGSVDIANTILEKISASALVVADVTPVLTDPARGLSYPNPNVMAEIGYAARSIGWSRIICVFNKVSASAEDTPFDIRHRRLTPYRCAHLNERASAIANLGAILAAAIRAMVEETDRGIRDPLIGKESLKRERDLRLVRRLVSALHRSTLDRFIQRGLENQYHQDADYFWYDFEASVCAADFRFYDKQLEQKSFELKRIWGTAVFYAGYAFFPDTRGRPKLLPDDDAWPAKYAATVKKMNRAFRELGPALNRFLDHVHAHFPEIDMDETDRFAWERNRSYIEQADK